MLFIVYGAPCSGKSTYVEANRGSKDVVFDYDEIAKALTGRHRPRAHELIAPITNLRSRLIWEYRAGAFKGVDLWIIATRYTDALRDEVRGLDVEPIELDPGIDACLERLAEDRDGRNTPLTIKAIENYYRRETDTSEVYNSKEWKRTRESILRRDEYRCQLCKRRGVAEDATQVHHINILTLHPELAFDERNLISLCDKCHGGLHDHLRDTLTTEGKQLQRRTNRRYGIGTESGGHR